MAHVFISYSPKHLALTERLKAFLQLKDLVIWIDLTSLVAHGPFDGQILAGRQQAEAVVVIGTTDAIVSLWFHLEADHAAKNRRLVNVEPAGFDRAHIPERLRKHHRHVQSDFGPFNMERILHDILAVCERRPLPAEVPLGGHYEDKYDELLLDTKRQPLPKGISETRLILLQAKYGIVDFIDIHGLKLSLIAWTVTQGEGARQRPAVWSAAQVGSVRPGCPHPTLWALPRHPLIHHEGDRLDQWPPRDKAVITVGKRWRLGTVGFILRWTNSNAKLADARVAHRSRGQVTCRRVFIDLGCEIAKTTS